MGKRQRRIRARSATGQVAGAAIEKLGLAAHRRKRPAQHAFSQKAPVPGPTTVDADPGREAVSCPEKRKCRRHGEDCSGSPQ